MRLGQDVGPYRILEKLGEGGMGEVYRARDTRLERDVALKFLREAPRASEQLLREARAASALNHPHICQIFDVGHSDIGDWIAMEYVAGEPLNAHLAPRGLPPEVAAALGEQLAAALAHAHAQGIIHRDFKTANCVRRSDGQVKILDFGLATRSLEHLAREDTRSASLAGDGLSGTPAYMAPEVIRGERADALSDLWALGVVLYELLTGTRPFSGSTVYELTSAILTVPPTPFPAAIPAPLAGIVLRLLEKDRTRRYQTADEVRAALEVCQTAAGSPPPQPVETPARRSRVSPAILIAAAVISVAIAAGLWFAIDRPLRLADVQLLSTFEGSHDSPAFSPNGDLVAFIAPDADRVPQVWVKNLAQGSPIQITSGGVAAERPRWRSDGTAIVFGRRGQGIWSVPALGGAPTRVVERGTNPNFSRNGSRMTWETPNGIWVAAADGSAAVLVAGVPTRNYSIPRMPALSPDGSRIAFFHAEAGPNGDLWVVPADGGVAEQLTHDTRDGSAPIWTNDGKRIIFSSARGGSRTLWQVKPAGGEPEPLTTGAGEDDAPELSNDGTRLVFTNTRNFWRINVAASSGAERTVLERRSELLFPIFSPDGSRIVFFGRAERAVAIFTIARDGSDLRQLTGGLELNHQPRWSHDGKDIYFYQSKPDIGVRRIPAIGGPSSQVLPWEWRSRQSLQFDASGRWLVYLRQNASGQPDQPEATVIREVATGAERELPPPHLHFPQFSHDGQWIAGWRHDNTVAVCDFRGTACRTAGQSTGAVAWSPDDSRLYVMRTAPASTEDEVWSMASAGGSERKERTLGTFRSIDRFFDLSIDGEIVSAPFFEGRRELWTATVR